MSLAVVGATVVTAIDPPDVRRADVLVDAGRVVAVGSGVGDAVVDRIDATGCLVMPGNVCAHTHLYSSLARGMPYQLAPPEDFLAVLQRVWWRLDRALDVEAIRASAQVGAMEALLAGTTTVIDHHASPDVIDGSLDVVAEALERLGLRSVLCYEVSDRDGPDRARAGIAENGRFLARTRARTGTPAGVATRPAGATGPGTAGAPGPGDLTRAMVGAHASFTLSEETLAGCVDAARAAGAGVHIHVAEDALDERDCTARFGSRVVPRLAAAGALTERSLLAHAVHLDRAEGEAVRASGATIAHNPRSNMNNTVGRAPLGWLGERVALGTDGIGGDLFEEARIAWLRRREEDRAVGPAWSLARLAQGAALAGRIFGEPLLGRVEPGAPADLAVLDYAVPAPLSGGSFAGHWGFGLSARHVRDVIVAGKLVVRDRMLTGADGEQVASDGRAAAARLWARLESFGAHPWAPGGIFS
jgi:putative selenium metabolism protein SsnA